MHLLADVEPFIDPDTVNQLEERCFKPGILGFQAFRIPDLLKVALKHGDLTTLSRCITIDDGLRRGDAIVFKVSRDSSSASDILDSAPQI